MRNLALLVALLVPLVAHAGGPPDGISVEGGISEASDPEVAPAEAAPAEAAPAEAAPAEAALADVSRAATTTTTTPDGTTTTTTTTTAPGATPALAPVEDDPCSAWHHGQWRSRMRGRLSI